MSSLYRTESHPTSDPTVKLTFLGAIFWSVSVQSNTLTP